MPMTDGPAGPTTVAVRFPAGTPLQVQERTPPAAENEVLHR
jgi:hypothetical protein